MQYDRMSYLTILGLIAAAFSFSSGTALGAPLSPQDVASLRHSSDILIGKGQRVEAANLLLQGLRDLPPERTDLAPSAVGVVQALLFNTEYLMHPTERETFFSESLDQTAYPMDILLATLMRYSDDSGISVEEAGRCVEDLYQLTKGDNDLVRLGALFTMASPYFTYDTPWAQVARDRIIENFPNSELAIEAQRLVLYRADQFGPEGLAKFFHATDQKDMLRKHGQRLREDVIGKAVYNTLQARGGVRDDASLVVALSNAAREARDWTEEYAALSILADLDPVVAGSRLDATVSESIERQRDPRTTFRARTIRLNLARDKGDAAVLLEETNTLLALDEIPLVPERNNYEELMRHTRQSAERLADLGQPEAGLDLLQQLAVRFPDSALALELIVEMDALADRKIGEPANEEE